MCFVAGTLCDTDVKECRLAPCQYGGQCSEPERGSYLCSCPPGITGTNCEEVRTANFNGSNVLVLPSLVYLGGGGLSGTSSRRRRSVADSAATDLQIRFTYTTTFPNGVLLFATGVRTLGGGVGMMRMAGKIRYSEVVRERQLLSLSHTH